MVGKGRISWVFIIIIILKMRTLTVHGLGSIFPELSGSFHPNAVVLLCSWLDWLLGYQLTIPSPQISDVLSSSKEFLLNTEVRRIWHLPEEGFWISEWQWLFHFSFPVKLEAEDCHMLPTCCRCVLNLKCLSIATFSLLGATRHVSA